MFLLIAFLSVVVLCYFVLGFIMLCSRISDWENSLNARIDNCVARHRKQ